MGGAGDDPQLAELRKQLGAEKEAGLWGLGV